MPSPFSTIVGSLLGLCSGASFTLNVVILIVLLRSKLPRNNPIYLLSALNLFSDCLQNAGILFFLTPTSIAQDYLLDLAKPNEPIWMVFMFVFQLQWYAAILILIAISVNRLIAVVFPAKSHLINREAVLWTCAAIFPLSLLLTMIADFLLPCCRTNYSFATYSYQFFAWKPDYNETGVNYKNVLLDLPLNIGASAILFFCYGIIFLKVLESNRKEVVRKSMEMGQKNRRMGEIRYAIQFGLMSAFFIAAWVSFRIFPAIVPANQPQWYSLTAFFVIGNCSANALIYMTMNQEVKNLLLNSMRRVLGLPSLSTIMTSQFPQQQPSKGPTPPIGLAAISSTIVQPLAGTENGAKTTASSTTPKWANRVGTARRK